MVLNNIDSNSTIYVFHWTKILVDEGKYRYATLRHYTQNPSSKNNTQFIKIIKKFRIDVEYIFGFFMNYFLISCSSITFFCILHTFPSAYEFDMKYKCVVNTRSKCGCCHFLSSKRLQFLVYFDKNELHQGQVYSISYKPHSTAGFCIMHFASHSIRFWPNFLIRTSIYIYLHT